MTSKDITNLLLCNKLPPNIAAFRQQAFIFPQF